MLKFRNCKIRLRTEQIMNKLIISLISLFLIVSTPSIAKKKLYRWVDENGKVTYSDQVPPEQIKKKHQELSGNGIVLEKVDRVLTDEEREAQRQEAIKQKELEEQAKADAKRRRNIIKAYSNEQEIIRLKAERLESLKRNIELAKKSLVFQNRSKEELLSRAADNERNGRKVSKALLSRIQIVEDKIKYQHKFIETKTKEIKTVTDKYDKDLEVYREAKSGLVKEGKKTNK